LESPSDKGYLIRKPANSFEGAINDAVNFIIQKVKLKAITLVMYQMVRQQDVLLEKTNLFI
jgi:hypothetical protein